MLLYNYTNKCIFINKILGETQRDNLAFSLSNLNHKNK